MEKLQKLREKFAPRSETLHSTSQPQLQLQSGPLVQSSSMIHAYSGDDYDRRQSATQLGFGHAPGSGSSAGGGGVMAVPRPGGGARHRPATARRL